MFKKWMLCVLVLFIALAGQKPVPGGSLDDCTPPPTSICGG